MRKSHSGADRFHCWFPNLRTSIKPVGVVAVEAFAVWPGTHAVLRRAQDERAQDRKHKSTSACEKIEEFPEMYHAAGCMKMRGGGIKCANTVPKKCYCPSRTCVSPTSPTVRRQFASRGATFFSFSAIIGLDTKPDLTLSTLYRMTGRKRY